MAILVSDDRERLCFMSHTGIQHVYDAKTEEGRNSLTECGRSVRGTSAYEIDAQAICKRCHDALRRKKSYRWHKEG